MNRTSVFEDPALLRRFRRQLLSWYRLNSRPLPWRRTKDPYRIWVSEIMLQQTRVAAVLEHYKRFLARFPSINALASASEADVLAQWSGLGYYRRARMLHQAAQLVQAEKSGRMPDSAQLLIQLPGIGRYTAHAIASIAFGEPAAVVDGNVERVLTRLGGRKLKPGQLWSAAQVLLDPTQPGHFNQAMMELGGTICVPGAPICAMCPVRRLCSSRGTNRDSKTVAGKRQQRSASLLLVQRGEKILLQQRSHRERLMPGMWELPHSARQPSGKPILKVKHAITITDWRVSVFRQSRLARSGVCEWVNLDSISRLPLTGLTRKILMNLRLLP